MHRCSALFDKYFALVSLEEEALAVEDIDRVNALASERTAILNEAWEEREGYDENALRQHIIKAGKCQEKLIEAAHSLHVKFKEQQKNGRKQSRYMNIDRNIHAELQKSFYCNKVS